MLGSRRTFCLFLKAAKAGDSGAQLDLGFFYDAGVGVKTNEIQPFIGTEELTGNDLARRLRTSVLCGARKRTLIGCCPWFHRAGKRGGADANLEIAQLVLRKNKDNRRAITYVKRTIMAGKNNGTEASKIEARRLLKRFSAP